MLRRLVQWLGQRGGSTEPSAQVASPPKKWLPIIDTDSCTGCGQCVEACEHGCLGMEWSFAKLQQPDDCDSEGRCAEACPHDVIRMNWSTAARNGQRLGRWEDRGEDRTET